MLVTADELRALGVDLALAAASEPGPAARSPPHTAVVRFARAGPRPPAPAPPRSCPSTRRLRRAAALVAKGGKGPAMGRM